MGSVRTVEPEGQQVSDQTLRDIAQALDRFEPPVELPIERLSLANGQGDSCSPRYWDLGLGPVHLRRTPVRARRLDHAENLPQAKYERLLLGRGHAKQRSENQPADRLTLKGFSTASKSCGRVSWPSSRTALHRTPDHRHWRHPQRLWPFVRRDNGVITQAAQVPLREEVPGQLPAVPLEAGALSGDRDHGRDNNYNRQEGMHAFAMVREGIGALRTHAAPRRAFPRGTRSCARTASPVPFTTAIRYILLNAVMHRDYSYYGGHVAEV